MHRLRGLSRRNFMEKIDISIIIPAYNGENYYQRCIDSIEQQNMDQYEVIIIDDGSTDRFYEKCKAYISDKKNYHIVKQKNQGVAVARNKGISLAKGEWLYFLDIDDELEKQALFEMKNQLENNIQWLLMSFSKHVVGEKRKYTLHPSDNIAGIQKGYNKLPKLLNEELFMYPCAKLYRRDIIISNQLGFPQGVKYGEDIRFNLEYFRHVQVYKVCRFPVMIYHIDQGKGAGSAYYDHSFDIQMDIDEKILSMNEQFYHLDQDSMRELNHYFFCQGTNTASAFLNIWKELPFLFRMQQIKNVLKDSRFIDFLEKEKKYESIHLLDYVLLKYRRFLIYYFIHYIYTNIKKIKKDELA